MPINLKQQRQLEKLVTKSFKKLKKADEALVINAIRVPNVNFASVEDSVLRDLLESINNLYFNAAIYTSDGTKSFYINNLLGLAPDEIFSGDLIPLRYHIYAAIKKLNPPAPIQPASTAAFFGMFFRPQNVAGLARMRKNQEEKAEVRRGP